jgi:hypothetical protein
MTEVLLVIFLLLTIVNVAFSIIRGWKGQLDYFFVYMQDKYHDRYTISSAVLVGLIFAFGLIFANWLGTKIVLSLIDAVYVYGLYLNFKKKLKPMLIKFL